MNHSMSKLLPALLTVFMAVSVQAEDSEGLGEAPEKPVSIQQELSDATADVSPGRLMVLGSPHLAQEFGEEFEHQWLDELLSGLEAFEPAVVAIEILRPEDIHAMRNFSDRPDDWEMVLDQFAGRIVTTADTVREELDLDWGEARRRQAELVGEFDAIRDEAEKRRKLALVSFAAYDYHTGLLHWGALPEDQREEDADLDEDTVQALNAGVDSANEAVSIGVNLARELDHARVYPVDDQKSLAIQDMAEHQRIEQMMSESSLRAEVMEIYEELQAEAMEASMDAENLLPLYGLLNSAEYMRRDLGAQWAAFFDERMDEDLGRTRMARREVRDLSIAANLREATARHPGEDALVIIGSSHKAFLESYLQDMSDLDLIQPQEYID